MKDNESADKPIVFSSFKTDYEEHNHQNTQKTIEQYKNIFPSKNVPSNVTVFLNKMNHFESNQENKNSKQNNGQLACSLSISRD